MAAKISLEHARKACADLVKAKDPSASLLSKYIPARVQDAYIGLRAFNIETARVVDGMSERKVAQLRLEFWKGAIQRMHSADEGFESDEPVTKLLHHSIKQGLRIPKRFLLTMVQTRESRLALPPIRTIEDMERLGEGTVSQLLYADLDVLQSGSSEAMAAAEWLSTQSDLDELVTSMLAHIGQASGIAGLLRGFTFYAQRHKYVTLPSSILSKLNISQQSILDGLPTSNLKDVVFEVATKANDHILTGRSLFKQLSAETGGVPPFIMLPAMQALPVELYLSRLESNDFDLGRRISEWRLPWRSWRAWRSKSI